MHKPERGLAKKLMNIKRKDKGGKKLFQGKGNSMQQVLPLQRHSWI
jgi:hypothetical protein